MRIESLSNSNRQTQGARRREWLRQHAPQHLEQCIELIQQGLLQRVPSASRATVVLGAGACTEVPLGVAVDDPCCAENVKLGGLAYSSEAPVTFRLTYTVTKSGVDEFATLMVKEPL